MKLKIPEYIKIKILPSINTLVIGPCSGFKEKK